MRVTTDTGTIDLGATAAAPTIGITDFSRRVTDDFGVTTVVERGLSRRLSVRLNVPFERVDTIQRQLAALRATAATWVAGDGPQALTVRGFYKDFQVDVQSPPVSSVTLTVEGLSETATAPDDGTDPAATGASTLRVLVPAAIGDAQLASSSVPEDDAPAWVSGTTYPIGSKVIRAHRVWENAAAAVGDDPLALGGKWLDTGPTNRWAALDQALGTATTGAGSVTFTIANAGAIGAVALLDVTGAMIRVQAPDYARDQPVAAGPITFLDLPGASTVTVTITGPAQVSVGTLLVGRLRGLGVTEAAPTAAITDFSRKDVDEFGEVAVVERAWAKRMAARALIRTDALDQVFNRVAAVRALPCLWIARAGMDALTIYGFWREFQIEHGPNVSKLSLSIEGLSEAAKLKPIAGAVDWPSVGDPDGTKPADNADVTGENTSKDTAAVAGRPAEEIVAGLDRIEPIAEAQELLGKAQGDTAAAVAQAKRATATLEQTLLRSVLENARTRQVLRDAGITVDPVTGTVRIFAIDQVSDRTSAVEIALDAARTQIALRATVDYVAEQIALAQLDPTGQAALEQIIARVTSAEVRLDGAEATIELKADAVTLTQLGGTVTSVRQDLDALAGVVSTKAERTDVDALGARVGSAEQRLEVLGDTSRLSVEIRQARLASDSDGKAALAALLTGEAADRRKVTMIAEARQELYARLVDGDAAIAGSVTILSARMGQSDARLASEILTRASETGALGQRIDTLQVTVGQQGQQLTAAVTSLTKAIADGDQASATAIQQVTARLDGFGGATIEQRFSALVNRTGAIEAKYALAIDTNGNLVGFQLIGSDAGPGSFNLVNVDLRMGTGRIIFNSGTVMRVQGTGFGAQGDLIDWYGPTMAIGQCSRENATSYLTTTGSAYFGGSLSAGTIKNAQQSTDLTTAAQVTVGPFTTRGGRKVVVVSYSYYLRRAATSGGSVTGQPSASLILERQLGTGAWEQVTTFSAAGSTDFSPPVGAEPGFGSQEMAGSVTVTDSTPGLSTFAYRLRIAARSLASFDFSSPSPGDERQSLSIVSVEE